MSFTTAVKMAIGVLVLAGLSFSWFFPQATLIQLLGLVGLAFSCLAVAQASLSPPSERAIPMGALHSHSGGVTNNISGTPIKIAGTYNLTGLESRFDKPVDGQLRYTAKKPTNALCAIHFSFSSDKNNKIITISVAKNGVFVADSQISTKVATGADVQTLSTSYLVSMSEDDYLEAFVDSDSGNPAITTEHITIMAWAFE